MYCTFETNIRLFINDTSIKNKINKKEKATSLMLGTDISHVPLSCDIILFDSTSDIARYRQLCESDIT